MTRSEWDEKWWEVYLHLRQQNPSEPISNSHRLAREYMLKHYGARPEGVAGPPWWMNLVAPLLGVPMAWLTGLWGWLDGKKTIMGAVITLVAYLVAGVPLVAAFCTSTVCAATVAKVGGIGLTLVGLLHKLYKLVYREEHP